MQFLCCVDLRKRLAKETVQALISKLEPVIWETRTTLAAAALPTVLIECVLDYFGRVGFEHFAPHTLELPISRFSSLHGIGWVGRRFGVQNSSEIEIWDLDKLTVWRFEFNGIVRQHHSPCFGSTILGTKVTFEGTQHSQHLKTTEQHWCFNARETNPFNAWVSVDPTSSEYRSLWFKNTRHSLWLKHASFVYFADSEAIMQVALEEKGGEGGGLGLRPWSVLWAYPVGWRFHNLTQFALFDDRFILCQFAQRDVYILEILEHKVGVKVVVAKCSLPPVLRVTQNVLWCADGTRVSFGLKDLEDPKPVLASPSPSPWVKTEWEFNLSGIDALLDAGNNLLLALETHVWLLLRANDLSLCCKGYNYSHSGMHRIIFHDSSFLHLANGMRLLYYTCT